MWSSNVIASFPPPNALSNFLLLIDKEYLKSCSFHISVLDPSPFEVLPKALIRCNYFVPLRRNLLPFERYRVVVLEPVYDSFFQNFTA